MKQRDISLSVVAILILLSPLSVHAQWVGPTQAPTGGNTSAPLNTGTSAQVKSGGLSVNAFTAWLNAYFDQNVGIGIVSPQSKLQVIGTLFVNNTSDATGGLYYGGSTNGLILGNYAASPWPGTNGLHVGGPLVAAGTVKITSGTPGAGKVLTSDASGLATWATPAVGSESDPTVLASVKDGVSWSEVTSRPAGLDDGDQVGITSITAGTGLSGGTITTSGTISADTTYLQRRVNGTCSGTQAIGSVNADGTVGCISPSFSESDTLATVTSRGATTGTSLTASSFIDGATGYYTDPASTSYINGLWAVGSARIDGTLDTYSNATFGNTSWSRVYLRDDESTSGAKSIHANSNVAGLLNGAGSWMVYWDTAGNQQNYGTINATNYLLVNGKYAIDGTDSWLRFNQQGSFANGIYTPGNFRSDGGYYGGGTVNLRENTTVSGSVTANAFYYSSDKDLKKNIEKLDGEKSLENIKKLRGVSFDWKKDGTSSIGLLAQDVEEVYPELVKTDEETGLKSVEYGNLVAPLIEAIKEQQTQIDALKKEVETLKASR